MISGFAAESIFNRKLAQCPKIKAVKFDSNVLIKIANSTRIGRRRLELARPYLTKEFGIPVRNNEELYRIDFDWNAIPASVILDRVFGIDRCFNFLGWTIAIDFSVNPDAISSKLNKLQQLRPLWSSAGIDRTAVCFIEEEGNPDLKQALRKVLRGAKTIAIAI